MIINVLPLPAAGKTDGGTKPAGRSAIAGRFAGLVGFPHYALSGRFAECAETPAADKDELAEFLNTAEGRAAGFYQRLLVFELKAKLAATD